jgi:hypothetical protein
MGENLAEGPGGPRPSDGIASSRLALACLCAYAADFYEAAKVVTSSKGAAFSPARLYLLSHALELALKAFLSMRERRSAKNIHALVARDDLLGLLAMAEACGLGDLVRLTPQQRAQIRKTAIYHSNAVFEYPALAEVLRGHPQTPDADALFGVLASLLSAVRRESAAIV